MNVTCPDCRTVFRVDPAKVPDGGVRARCAVCGGLIAVRVSGERNADFPEATPSTAPVPASVRGESLVSVARAVGASTESDHVQDAGAGGGDAIGELVLRETQATATLEAPAAAPEPSSQAVQPPSPPVDVPAVEESAPARAADDVLAGPEPAERGAAEDERRALEPEEQEAADSPIVEAESTSSVADTLDTPDVDLAPTAPPPAATAVEEPSAPLEMATVAPTNGEAEVPAPELHAPEALQEVPVAEHVEASGATATPPGQAAWREQQAEVRVPSAESEQEHAEQREETVQAAAHAEPAEASTESKDGREAPAEPEPSVAAPEPPPPPMEPHTREPLLPEPAPASRSPLPAPPARRARPATPARGVRTTGPIAFSPFRSPPLTPRASATTGAEPATPDAPASAMPVAPRASAGTGAPDQVAPTAPGVRDEAVSARAAIAPALERVDVPTSTSVTPASLSQTGKRPINPFLANDPNQRGRRLARALVSDMIAYHPQKRDEGLRTGTLRQLFREEIKKSFEEYVDQVGREFAESTTHFQDALNDLLAGGQKIF